MALAVGVNSWVTRSEADTFMADQLSAASWAAMSNAQKDQSLVTAFWKIYGNKNYTISKTSTDEKVKAAQILTASYIYENFDSLKKRLALQGQGVSDFTISKFSETLKDGSWLPVDVKDLLDSFASSFHMFATVDRELD
jgi:hypothetical protein